MTPSESDRSLEELLAHGGWLKRLAAQLVGPHLADDLVQETWVSALGGKAPRGEGLRPWLGRVLRNRSIDWRRGQERRDRREVAAAREEAVPGGDEMAERAEAMGMLVKAVQGLPKVQRDVVMLRYFEELAPAEIAVRWGMPASTVRSHLRRGMEGLREALDSERDRNTWMGALAPLALANGVPGVAAKSAAGGALGLSTSLIMGTATKTALALGSVLVLGLVWNSQRTEGPGETNAEEKGLTHEMVDGPGVEGPGDVESPEGGSEMASSEGGVRQAASGTAEPTLLPIVGSLVAKGSGEPLAFASISLVRGKAVPIGVGMEMPKGVETVQSDAQGMFQTTEVYPAGIHHATILDYDDPKRDSLNEYFKGVQAWGAVNFEHEPGSPVRLEFDGGCVYTIDCPQAASMGTDQFLVQLSEQEQPKKGVGAWSALLPGSPPVVRFAPPDAMERRQPREWLHLVSKDGAWVGSARVEPCQGIGDPAVSIRLTACGAVRLKVEADMPPFTEGLLFSSFLGEVDDSKDRWRQIARTRPWGSASSGGASSARPVHFTRDFEPLGRQTIRVQTSGFADHVQEIEVLQGENPEVAIVMRREEQATGKIHGLVRTSADGPPDHEVIVQVNAVGDSGQSFRTAKVEWAEEGGAWVGRFEVVELLDREYRVLLTPGMSVPRKGLSWKPKPRAHTVRPGGPTLEYRLGKAPARFRYEVSALDRTTGDPLDSFSVMPFLAIRGEGEQDMVEGSKGSAEFSLPATPDKVRLLVVAEGYAPNYLEFAQAFDSKGVSKNTLRLAKGWGGNVRVVDRTAEEAKPVAGVSVWVDGVDMGQTDLMGLLWLEMGERPKKIELKLDGYTISKRYGPIDEEGMVTSPKAGALMDGFSFHVKRG